MYRIQYFCICTLCFCALLVVAGCGSNPIRTGGNSPPGTNPPTPPPPPPPSATVVVTPASATVLRGKTQLFTATVSGQADQTVIWSLDDRIGSIDSTGLYTAPSNFDGLTTSVIATSKAVPSGFGTALVTLPTIPFSITPARVGVVPGASQAFSATVVGLDSAQVSWTVQGGGTISSAGLYSAPSTSGLSYVVATASANTNYSASAFVLVATNATVSSPTGNLQDGREFHTATLLPNGKVLVAGGAVIADEYNCVAGTDSAELYDLALGTFASTGPMTSRRYAQTSTLLQNGTVLITGGFSFDRSDCDNDDTSPAVASAEIYDPSHGSFAPTGSMAEERGGHTATLLTNGKVLIAGGDNIGGGYPPFFYYVDGSVTAELYDPVAGRFTSTGNMGTPRVGQTATLLVDGDVLIAGGWSESQNASIAAAELYHPATGAFTPTGGMNSPRTGHTATLLPDGKVLIAGGAQDRTLVSSDTAEIYDPATGSFLATGSMAEKRCSHTATLLPNGTVLIAGGGSVVTEIYDPSTGSFVLSGLTEFDRSGHSATLLQNGNVLVVGGLPSPNTAELYP
jgi:hypothetical protein